MFTGKIVRVFPEQKYGIVVPFGTCARGLREVIISMKDQRAIDGGQINPEKVRITIPEVGMIVKFLLDYRSDITPIAFLWALNPKINTNKATARTMSVDGKKPKNMAHNYPRYERYGNPSGEVEATVHQEEKLIPETAQRPAQDFSSAQPGVKKETPEVSRSTEQKIMVVIGSEKPASCCPKFGRDNHSHSNNGQKRKVGGKRKVQDKKQHKGKQKYPTYGCNFRYLGRDIGATSMPDKTPQKRISEVPSIPNESQTVKNDPAQIEKPDFVPGSPAGIQKTHEGWKMSDTLADKAVAALNDKVTVRLGIVGV